MLTPKVEYYKHLVDHYKKTLETLNQNHNNANANNGPAKNTFDFLFNKQQPSNQS